MKSRDRFHLTLTVADRPVIHGWWGGEAAARLKFSRWIGAYGSLPKVRVTLTDEQERTVLTSWPDPH
ncbi:hypothetical protein OG331_47460 [Streptomyces sp. NBC_01017]|uniref:hypothetical protein n=1 Tax=Streptomyces sp. NBC_01017 TaxID=2903721 RepID=UPI003864AFD9|nr:hypothetical protein OG331_04520 [Streptomyces sp. NBC_01017]WSV34715.1 hypothetical protein OG331_47460 [Streptomyces sp. NBC_01017]